MCLFHLQLLRQVFCGANTDNGFPVHQGTASLQNNNVPATTGLALGQHQLSDFIPNVHIMLATLLSFWLFSVSSPVRISVIQKRSLDIYNFHLKLMFDNWESDSMSWKEEKNKSQYVTLQHFRACDWKDETLRVPSIPYYSLTALCWNTYTAPQRNLASIVLLGLAQVHCLCNALEYGHVI